VRLLTARGFTMAAVTKPFGTIFWAVSLIFWALPFPTKTQRDGSSDERGKGGGGCDLRDAFHFLELTHRCVRNLRSDDLLNWTHYTARVGCIGSPIPRCRSQHLRALGEGYNRLNCGAGRSERVSRTFWQS
jgi:hypothetical protein